MKKLQFILTLSAAFFYLTSLANVGQVNIRIHPAESNGYLCWEAIPNSSYEVLLLEQTIGNNSSVTYTTLTTLTPSVNYVRLDAQYLNQADYYFKIVVTDAQNTVSHESDYEGVCTDCEEDAYNNPCMWKCNGVDYAWEIRLWENDMGSNGYLQVASTVEMYDYDEDVAIPFYEAMTPTVFSAKGYFEGMLCRKHYKLEDVTAGDAVRDADNNILTGTVFFVEKKLEQFSPLASIYSDILLISANDCIKTRTWAQETYNDDLEVILPILLTCQPAFGAYDDDGDLDDDDDGNEQFWYDVHDLWDTFNTTISELLKGLPGLSNNGQGWISVNEYDSDFSFVHIQKVDGGNTNPVLIEASELFNDGNNYTVPSYTFSSGLYCVTLIFEDGSAIPLYMEHDNSTYVPQTNAAYGSLTIAPNPVQNNVLQLVLDAERKMTCELQIRSLSGAYLYSEQIQFDGQSSQQKNIPVPSSSFPYNQLVVKLIFSDDSVIESIALKP